MVLYGYDAAVFNAVQGNKHWLAYFDTPKNELLGLINTSYSIGAIYAGLLTRPPFSLFHVLIRRFRMVRRWSK
jgi:hypothetical protein